MKKPTRHGFVAMLSITGCILHLARHDCAIPDARNPHLARCLSMLEGTGGCIPSTQEGNYKTLPSSQIVECLFSKTLQSKANLRTKNPNFPTLPAIYHNQKSKQKIRAKKIIIIKNKARVKRQGVFFTDFQGFKGFLGL